ncbi:FDXHR family putative zinc-binding protein [Mycobacterium avium]|uniref:FDXHR family putative zinc-binding protein n=2 Tax=Mycobacterium avium TaxID=1764 RepID=UPI003FF00C5B
MTTTKSLPFGCARCDTRWKGHETCHCGKCHQTFAYIGSFDRHTCGVPARLSRSEQRMTGVAA